MFSFSSFLGVPVDAAYHVVTVLAGYLSPLPGGLAAAAAIVLFTVAVRLLLLPLSYRAMRGMDAQARMAPQLHALRKKYSGQPDRLQRELAAMYQSEGTSSFAGCGPMLLQWPFLSIMYLLFRSPVVGGVRNSLLTRHLFGAPLGSHWLGAAGPFSAQGAVFAGLFALLGAIGWLSAAMARRSLASGGTGKEAAPVHGQPAGQPGIQPVSRPDGAAAAQASGVARAVASLTPYVTVALAAFVPLAAGLYLATTTAWTLAERTLLRRTLVLKQAAKAAGAGQRAAGRRAVLQAIFKKNRGSC